MSMTDQTCKNTSPFDLDDDSAYQAWRSRKLAAQPLDSSTLIVPINNPELLEESEILALTRLVRSTNMAIYDTGASAKAGRQFIRHLGERFGLRNLDGNPYSDEDDISSISVKPGDQGAVYIPYTDRPISWHTDGYYNSQDTQVRSFILHCAYPASEGGENRLLDPELAYIYLRDIEPSYIQAFMAPDVMTIPANEVNDFINRPAQSGPVYSLQADGSLHMRFTARKKHVIWSSDPAVSEAREALSELLNSNSPFIHRHRLEAGQGLLTNNVLHNRSMFRDAAGGDSARLLYRARYYERIKGTGPDNLMEAQ